MPLGTDEITIDASLAARDSFADPMNLEAARKIFSEAKIGDTTPFARVSLSATVGWMAVKAIQGTPNSALDRELDATDAAFAVVMYGTNDTWAGGQTQFRQQPHEDHRPHGRAWRGADHGVDDPAATRSDRERSSRR